MISTRKICIIGDSDSGKTTFIKLMITGIYTEKVLFSMNRMKKKLAKSSLILRNLI